MGERFRINKTLPARITSIALVSFILFIQVCVSVPFIHKYLHADADSPEHSCIVTLFNKAQVDLAITIVSVKPLFLISNEVSNYYKSSYVPYDFVYLQTERSPPIV